VAVVQGFHLPTPREIASSACCMAASWGSVRWMAQAGTLFPQGGTSRANILPSALRQDA